MVHPNMSKASITTKKYAFHIRVFTSLEQYLMCKIVQWQFSNYSELWFIVHSGGYTYLRGKQNSILHFTSGNIEVKGKQMRWHFRNFRENLFSISLFSFPSSHKTQIRFPYPLTNTNPNLKFVFHLRFIFPHQTSDSFTLFSNLFVILDSFSFLTLDVSSLISDLFPISDCFLPFSISHREEIIISSQIE